MRKSHRHRSLALIALGAIVGASRAFSQYWFNYTLSSHSSSATNVTTANENCVVTINTGVQLNATDIITGGLAFNSWSAAGVGRFNSNSITTFTAGSGGVCIQPSNTGTINRLPLSRVHRIIT